MITDDLLQRALGKNRVLSPVALEKLRQFADLVQKWNPSINIVARSSLDDLWHRHILDSIQVFSCADGTCKIWLDIGSGGGFPGLVIAILAAELLPDMKVVLIESDKRKSVFLSEASRLLGLSTTVHAKRIEDLPPQNACVVSARALAPLGVLCDYSAPHLREGGVGVFPKGLNHAAEIEEAQKRWQFQLDQVESVTDSRSSVLFLRELRRV